MILGIETSCDETSVAVLESDGTVRANLIASQVRRHEPFGGVVPEIASREHLEQLMPLVHKATADAGVSLSDIDRIAVTNAPGLIGALLVGVAGAQGLSYGLGIPVVPVNHLEGHIVSPYLRSKSAAVPLPERFFSIVVSGGHSSIYDVVRSEPRMLNRTRDDAAGEVFDKVAKFVGLPYPGGPHVERVGRAGDASRHRFPVAALKDESLDFSFSGLKSSAIRVARQEGLEGSGDEAKIADLCASLQRAIVEQIIDRLERLWARHAGSGEVRPSEVSLAGGVAANGALREAVTEWGAQRGVTVRLPEKVFCTDNAAMIAWVATLHPERSSDPRRVEARSRMQVGV